MADHRSTLLNVFHETCGIASSAIQDTSRLTQLVPDSLEQVELIMSIEEALDTEIPMSAWDECQTFGDLLRYVEAEA